MDKKEYPKPFIIVENLTISVNGRDCFQGTDFVLRDDEQWAVIGSTGSGKSILAKALCQRAAVVAGRIRYCFDDSADGRSPRRGELALVSAETHAELVRRYAAYHQARWHSFEDDEAPTVAELLTGRSIERISPYDMTPLAVDEAEYAARRERVAEMLGLSRLLGRKIIHLSNGETRKFLLARALMQTPRLLALDDPYGGLDKSSRETLARCLDAILAEGRQRLLLVTSRREELPVGITHILCVADHRVAIQGHKAAVLDSPLAQAALAPEPPAAYRLRPLPVAGWETFKPGSPLIELRDVRVEYDGVAVLSGVTWTLRQGERWALRGPNGAGKSTLLSLILADNPQAYANDLRLFGHQRGTGETIWDIKRRIGWVAPELGYFYHSEDSCESVVRSGFHDSIGLYEQATEEESRRAAEWLEALDLQPLARESFHSVSVGEQRLVLLARALVKRPALLVLDEPCQGLDAAHRSRIVAALNALCRETSVSLLYVSHHADELPQAIDHVLELESGIARISAGRAILSP